MKHLEGKTIHLLPTGNNVSRSAPERILTATVKKVARTMVTLEIGERRVDEKFRMNGPHLDGGYNSGYLFFESQETIDDYRETKRIAKLIADRYRYSKHYEELGLENLRQVARLLKIDTEEQEP